MTLSPETNPHRRPGTEIEDAPSPGGGARSFRSLSVVLLALAVGMATVSLIGPIGLEWLQYRTSPTTLNQLLGSDTAALVFITPLALAAALLCARGHRAGPVLGNGISVFALYTYAQVIIGQEYLRIPGNVEYWFPLLLTVFILAEATLALSWRALPPELPRPTRRMERAAAITLLLVAVFLVFGLHLRTLLIAWQDPGALTEYTSSPTPFWLVKLMDLGIIVPAAIATGIGLLSGARWARRAMYPLLTGYTCLAVSVATMAVVMNLNTDPDASVALAAGFLGFALAFVALMVGLYRPLFRHSSRGPDDSSPAESGPVRSATTPDPFKIITSTHPRGENTEDAP
ncbi:hypothetical protein NYP18_09735 [Corynebacterium sp. YIM 101645]|uniref:Uncharacterized protein n=1 Tax=Corynebacterium lemuris TaxID=1859292 RepID=A0ABT2FXH0_9CORY|nr:hypothetical protein [Corynebacterium lemuris]MCS5479935.1 hypothetical protein [Corynebacterium lemuris]